ncbi:hypothetical protein M1O20_03815 [Dehalococcoidia bacterium]|nr:hypothetical protein [Dehalococcoidia bacterium]
MIERGRPGKCSTGGTFNLADLDQSRIARIVKASREKMESSENESIMPEHITFTPETLTDKEKEALIAGYVNARC